MKHISNTIRRILRRHATAFPALLAMCLLYSCATSKHIPEGQQLLTGVEIRADQKGFDPSRLQPYIRQKANSRWFSLFTIPLATYSLSGPDTTKWINRTLQRIGEAPVLYSQQQAQQTCEDLRIAMNNMGYMDADVTLQTISKRRTVKVIYTLHPGLAYRINTLTYDIQDPNIRTILQQPGNTPQLHAGTPFTIDALNAERKRITSLLLDSGYYRFNKDFIVFDADTVTGSTDIDLTLRLLRYKATNNSPDTLHPRYTIKTISYINGEGGDRISLRPSTLHASTALKANERFSSSALQKTYNNFARLQAVRYTSIRFTELPDDSLDCEIQLSTNKPHAIAFQPEGTNTAGDFGAAATLTYQNRNLFHGSEVFSLQLRAAFEAITGLEGYQNQDYEEYNVETRLQFPRFVAPFLSRSFRNKSTATSELSLSYNLQNRPEFHRRVFSAAWRYRWSEPRHHTAWRIDLLDLNYVYMPWMSPTFKEEYLDNASSRNVILRYNYEDLFIMKTGASLSYTNRKQAFKVGIETAGNMLSAAAHILGSPRNSEQQYTLFNIAFAQYAKADIDYTRILNFDPRNSLAIHLALGISYPYGNSNVLPFEKRYFSGGANSVRGWSVRSLGPGSYRGTDGRIDFINQTGDMKLDLSMEYRTALFWKLHGAFFIDGGNIWTLRAYEEQPGGQFKFNRFYKEIAASYGLGLRLNLDYFLIRFDIGMKAINPAYQDARRHYPIAHPSIGRDMALHFAVGMPF